MNVRESSIKKSVKPDSLESLVEDSAEESKFQENNIITIDHPKISIVIPVYNEQDNIGNLINKIPKKENYHIVVVNDGSTDNSLKVLKKIKNRNIYILNHTKNKGYGAAVSTGITFSNKKNYDIIILLDGDGQHDPKYIPKYIELISKKGYEFVIGNRFSYPYAMSTCKKLCSKMISAFYLFFLHKKIHDPTNGFRALSSRISKNLVLESSYSISQEMLLKILPKCNLKEIPIKIYNRKNGKSFIRIQNYFCKMFLFILKYYIFPRINFISKKILKEKIRKRIGLFILKT